MHRNNRRSDPALVGEEMMAELIESLLAEIERLKTKWSDVYDENQGLRTEIEALKREKDHYIQEWSDACDENQGLLNQLTASQARERLLRDALEYIMPDTPDQCRVKNNALFLPTDDTALKTAIQHGIADFLERTGQYVTNDASRNAALAAERERCVKIIDAQMIGFAEQDELLIDMLKAVRALGD